MRIFINIALMIFALLVAGIIWYSRSSQPSADITACNAQPILTMKIADRQSDLINPLVEIFEISTNADQAGSITVSHNGGELIGPSESLVSAKENHSWFIKASPDEETTFSAIFVNSCGQISQSMGIE